MVASRKSQTLYIIRLPWGEESLPSPVTLEDIRADIGIAWMYWKKGKGNLTAYKNPTFDIFTYKDGKRSKSGSVVLYTDMPLWFSKGKAYAFHRNGKIATEVEV